MPKEEWGVKRLCPDTGKRFYDMNADPDAIVSPYSGNTFKYDEEKGVLVEADAVEEETAAENVSGQDDVGDDPAVEDDKDVTDVDLDDDDVLDDDDEDNVSLDDIADVASDEEH